MGKRKKPSAASTLAAAAVAISRAKGFAKNQAWNMLHRMESMAATAMGTKIKRRKKPTSTKESKGKTVKKK